MFEEYELLSKRVIESDEVLSKYESDLYKRSKYISNLLLNTNALDKLLHPIRLVRTKQEDKRIQRIKTSYYELKNSSLVEHFDEESGELDHDFYAAATYFKPRRMRKFTKKNPIKIKKKLLTKKR